MGILSGLFGGGSQTQTATSAPWAAQAPYLKDLFSGAQNLYNQGYQVAPFTPAQQMGQGYGMNFAQNLPNFVNQTSQQQQRLYGQTPYENMAGITSPFAFGNYLQGSQGPTGQYGQTISDLMSGNVNLDAYNPIASSITEQMTQNFRENILPGIRRNSLQASGVPTSRASIPTRQAASDFTQDLGSTLNNLYLPAYQQAQQQRTQGAGLYGDALHRQLSAAGMGFNMLGGASQLGSQNISNALSFSPTLANMGYMPSQIMQDIGARQQQQNQMQLDAPFTNLQRYQSLIGGNYGGTQTQTTPMAPPFGALAGLGLGLGGGYLGGLSGRDLLGAGALGMNIGRLF